MRKIQKQGRQQGVALVTVLLVLILLSAMALGLMYMSTTETLINANYRNEQAYYFAAKAGMEELRDRLMASNASTISTQIPTAAPDSSGNNIKYMFNGTTVNPWDNSSPYFDSELCHDNYPGTTSVATDLPCSSSYYGGATPTAITGGSVLPYKSAIPFKWARISWKLNNSVPNRLVNNSYAVSAPVCWNGTYELPTASTCQALTPSANQVYLISALAASNTTGVNQRKMVQAEVALQPAQPFPYGLFATGSGCGAVTLGGGASTDSFSSANGAYSNSNSSNTGGDVGSNGNTLAKGSSQIGGSVGSPVTPAVQGACPATLTTTGGAGMISDAGHLNQLLTFPPVVIPTPTIANTTGPSYSQSKQPPNPLPPGNYGDISLSSHMNLTLNSGVYNVTSLSVTGQATITINGAVTLNIVSTSNTSPLDLEGGGFSNTSGIASNFQINYAGPTGCSVNPCGSVKVAGGQNAYMVLDAPNTAVTLVGNSDFYGAVVGNQIDASGGARFHYDRNTKSPVPSNSYYSLISFRDLPY
jgi:Tfp pilus assembly protein PilX